MSVLHPDPWALAVLLIALVLIAIGLIISSVAVCRDVFTNRRRSKDS